MVRGLTGLCACLIALVLADSGPAAAQSARPPLAATAPPVARKVPHVVEAFGRRRVDDYDWMRNTRDLLPYLVAENAYADARLARLRPLIEKLEAEGSRRADDSEETPDFAENGYVYQRRTAAGARFPVMTRRKEGSDAAPQVVLDIESLGAGHQQYDLNGFAMSPDGNLVAFAVDFTGGRQHQLFIRDIATGEVRATAIANADSELAFSTDSKQLFYLRTEAGTVRANQLWRHTVGTDASADKLLYEEADPTYELHLEKSKSGRFILLTSATQRSSEVRTLSADRPDDPLTVMEPRRRGVFYVADHVADRFYIRTNLGAPDFRVVVAPEAEPQATNWTTVVPETPGHHIARLEVFDDFLAINVDHDAVRSVRVFRRADATEIPVPQPAGVSVMEMVEEEPANRDPAATRVQLRLSAPNLPFAFHDFDTRTGALSLVRKSPAWDWFDPAAYEVRRIAATAPDGEAIPVTLMYRKDLLKAGGNPALITAYGAYGISNVPRFKDTWISLIDRGFVYAIAHVRGGRDKGRRWYDQGRMLNKRNSFTDFIAVTEGLTAQGFADPKRMFAYGASAGGMLVGAVVNMRPDLYAGIVAEVPAMDIASTMTDPRLPLTTLEYEEWGNPAIEEQYRYMLSYSPYDNVSAQAYPPAFVIAGLQDSLVGVHEPAKWVARLRATKTDRKEILFVTNLSAGHGGTSGRFGTVEIDARVKAWLIGLAATSGEAARE
ncbi:MAG: S9 family peptidase [Alphaproteobacteria bacterium]